MHHGLEELAVGEGAADQEEEEEDQRRRGPHRVTTLSTTVRVSFTENYVLSPAEFRFLTVCWCGVTWRSPLMQAQVEEEYVGGGGGGEEGEGTTFHQGGENTGCVRQQCRFLWPLESPNALTCNMHITRALKE